ncbi:MAG: hypothetical protein MJK04_09910 [Psychrosphaera sp.]|nr:hypothetical protein [Psychrosphaera sp.]
MRYAVHHARKHKLDRIIYIIPFTSIIDQNAEAIRKALKDDDELNPWVLEQHSNLEPEQQTWRSKLASENWDAPIVLTTMVQFLETLFGGGTRGVRKLHQLANSVIVFDEIQTLPINCVHLFCNSINFLAAHCITTAVMCTATQPLLNRLEYPKKGLLHLRDEDELMPDVGALFDDLKRVTIVDKTKKGGWTVEEVTELALAQVAAKNSCLIIVNTKDWARRLFQACMAMKSLPQGAIFHLSTAQCPVHRKTILDQVKARLKNKLPTLCISTQLIEAGVDVDFASVIRFVAGLDSIAQAAGRCNRNGYGDKAEVLVVNPDKENIDTLVDIVVGIAKTKQVFNEFKGQNLLLPEVMKQYFEYFFFDRADQMSYQCKDQKTGESDNLLNLLSHNKLNP